MSSDLEIYFLSPEAGTDDFYAGIEKIVSRAEKKKNQDYVIKTCYSNTNMLLATPISPEAFYGGQIKVGV